MITKNYAIYARVSTQEQAEEGFSIESQIKTLTDHVVKMGACVYDVYIDSGISGKSMDNRPELKRMLSDAEQSRFQEVLVWKINRLSRSTVELLKIVKELEKKGVEFKSYTENFDTTTPTGKLIFNVIASIGEFERETIVENVKAGMKQRASQGLFNGGHMLGYQSIKIDDDRKKSILEVIPEEADIVKLIFEMYVNGAGFKKISNKINDCGYRTVKGNLFSIHAVRDIIMNPAYAGYIRFNYKSSLKKEKKAQIYKGQHQAIISDEVWNKAQAIMESRKHGPRKVHKGVFLLTGLLKCPVCGSSMVAGRSTHTRNGKKKTYCYYQCSKYKNYGRNACKPNSINQEYAERFVLDRLMKFSINDELIEQVITRINEHSDTNLKPLRNRYYDLETSIEACVVKKERIFDLYESGDIDKSLYRSRIEKVDAQVLLLESQFNEIKKELDEKKILDQIPIKHVKRLLGSFGTVLEMSNRDQKKVLLNLVIDRISTGNDRKIKEITLRFDEKIQKHLVNEDSSDNEESSIFMPFKLSI